jgi:hypothetical protein
MFLSEANDYYQQSEKQVDKLTSASPAQSKK